MEHIFNIAINVEDERIVSSIEEKAESRITETLVEKTLDAISTKRRVWGRSEDERDFSRLREIVNSTIESVIRENKDIIIKEAVATIARKIYGSKACKEAVAKMLDKEE